MVNFGLSELDRLNRTELIKAWVKTYISPPPKRSRRSFLITSLAYRTQEQAGGGLRPETRKCLITIAIAERAKMSEGYVRRILPLASLAPNIVEAILDGRQPDNLTAGRLEKGFPVDWTEQRRILGFSLE